MVFGQWLEGNTPLYCVVGCPRAFPYEVQRPSKRGRFTIVQCSYGGVCVRCCLYPLELPNLLSQHVCRVDALLVTQAV